MYNILSTKHHRPVRVPSPHRCFPSVFSIIWCKFLVKCLWSNISNIRGKQVEILNLEHLRIFGIFRDAKCERFTAFLGWITIAINLFNFWNYFFSQWWHHVHYSYNIFSFNIPHRIYLTIFKLSFEFKLVWALYRMDVSVVWVCSLSSTGSPS